MKIKKQDITDVVRSALLAVIMCLIMILIFAIIAKFCPVPDSVILPVNIMIKVISVTFGVIFGLKTAEHGAIKGLLTGMLFSLVTYLLFSIINNDFSADWTLLIDSVVLIVEGIISGIIVVNIKGRNKR